MAPEYQPSAYPFTNKGIKQKDAALLEPGEFYDALNVVTVQEGVLVTRSGRKVLGSLSAAASNPNKIAKLSWSGTDSNNPRYISEGSSIWRTLDYASFTEVATGVADPATAVQKRFGASSFHAGSYSGEPYMYLATPLKMLKDYGRTPYASLRQWGILPPAAAASGVRGTPYTKNIFTAGTTYTGALTGYEYINLVVGGSLDLAAFDTPSVAPSGYKRDGYDSADYIEMQLQLENVQAVGELRLWIDCDDGSFQNYYEKAIAPNQLQPAVVLSETVNEAITTTDPYTDEVYELQPAYTTLDEILRIPKNSFRKINQAGQVEQDTLNWKSVVAVRILIQTLTTGYDTTVVYVKLVGGFGPDSEATPTAQPYDYLYCYRNTTTGNFGNPSPAMASYYAVNAKQEPVVVTVYGTADANISGANSIAIYRRGGVFTDGLYRLVGYATNPGETAGVPNSVTFQDSFSDSDLVNAAILEFDNDPPVTSPLPTPFRGALTADYAAGWRTISFSGSTTTDITVGTRLQVIRAGNSASDEEVVVQAVISSSSVRVFFQNAHVAGEGIICSYVVGKACRGVFEAFESLFVYGDSNNPHILYKSKKGRPEAFPVINESDGTSNQVVVGNPGNPIQAATEWGGEVVSLNLKSIFVIPVWGSQMQRPVEVPAKRGLFAPHAWCKGDNYIYYLAYDGVYAWSGGQSVKISQDIDWMFKKRVVNGLQPIDLGQVTAANRDYIAFEFHKNYLYIVCWDAGGNLIRLRFNTIDLTWVRESFANTSANFMLAELDTGDLISCRYNAAGGVIAKEDEIGTSSTSDDYSGTSGLSGTAIPFLIRTGFYSPGGPSVSKLFGDVLLELKNPYSDVLVKMYYDHSTTVDPVDQFTITAAAGRRLIPLPLQQSGGYTSGKEARSISLEISGAGGFPAGPTELYSVTINYLPRAQVQYGRASEWDDGGYPHDKRLYEFVIEYDTAGGSVDLALDTITGVDGSTNNLAVQTFTITGSGRAQATIKANDGIIAKKFRVRPTVETAYFKVFGIKYLFEEYPPDIVPFTPYSDYGHEWEKHLRVLHLDVDTGGVNVTVAIEGDGATLQTITVNSTEATRNQQHPINLNLISKKIRLKVTSVGSGGKFQLHGHRFEFDKYPPDVVYATEISDYGYQYLKYLQQLVIDVNTGGQIVPVIIEGDGSDLQTVQIQTSATDRRRTLTLNQSLTARKIRLKVTPGTIPSGGRFQLFDQQIIFLPADKGPVKHTFDWDRLDYLFDKRLTQLVLEYDKGVSACTMLMDTLTGLNGDQINLAVQSIVLTGTGRSVQPVPLADSFVVKAVRLRPQAVPNVNFKHWDYNFTFEKLPPDITLFTEWSDLGWACDKTFRNVVLEVNTGGVAATVNVQLDGTTVQTFSVTSTDTDRVRILTFDQSYSGKLFRVTSTPGSGGKFQIYNVKPDFVKEPCAVTRWDSLEVSMGYNGYKFLKQVWLQYVCASTVTFSIYRDGETLFYQKSLPAQSAKEVQRFYLPENVSTALNKSKRYRFVLTSSTAFKFWAETSRIEWMPLGYDMRQAFAQMTFHHMLQPAAFAEAAA